MSTASGTAVTRTLAKFIVESRWEDIPAGVKHEAHRALLNWLGCAVGSSRHETVKRAMAALEPFAGTPQAIVYGQRHRVDCLSAALVNGISSHVLDFDDTHQRTVHPSAPVLPALLALGEWKHIEGERLMHAYILGVEAECRIGLSVFPEHYDIGWHITGTAGAFGAAAACAKALGLDEQQTTWALGIAATQAAGLRDMFGSMCKSLHPGRAAQNGLTAAMLAQNGFTSSERGIEAPRGFANVTSTKFDPSIITEGLGKTYELSRNMYKPYACGLVVHAAIDGCIELKRQHQLDPAQIAAVELRVNPLVLELTAKRAPQDGLEGKFSVYHACAVALLHEAAGEAQFADAVVRDPGVIALRDKVVASADASVGKLQAGVTIRMQNGTVHEHFVQHALGTVERPMSDTDLEAKFRGLTEGIYTPTQADRVIAMCWKMAGFHDTGILARAAIPY